MRSMKDIGLDVHKERTEIGEVKGRGQGRIVGSVSSNPACVEKALRKLGATDELRVVYEAGPTGYVLYRYLQSRGYEVSVVAPSMTPRQPGCKQKTDRRDALVLARQSRAGDLSEIHVPSRSDEAMRDLVRAREDAMVDLRRAKQRFKMFLLRQGKVYPGKCDWTEAHLRYLAGVNLPEAWDQVVYQEYLEEITRQQQRLGRFTPRLLEALEGWEKRQVVKGLMAFRGIDWLGSMSLVAELIEPWRFTHPRKLMGYIGMGVVEDSTGTRRRQGSITKTGNRMARWILVEAAQSYGHKPRVSVAMKKRAEGVPREVQEIAWRAQVRLCGRYRKMRARHKPANKAKVAIARELSAFVWEAWRELEVQSHRLTPQKNSS